MQNLAEVLESVVNFNVHRNVLPIFHFKNSEELSRKELVAEINSLRMVVGDSVINLKTARTNHARLSIHYREAWKEYTRVSSIVEEVVRVVLTESNNFVSNYQNHLAKEYQKMAKKKEKKPVETPAPVTNQEPTMPDPEVAEIESTPPDLQPDQLPGANPNPETPFPATTVTDRRALEICFNVTLKEEDRPNVAEMSDEQVVEELGNLALLKAPDKRIVLERFPEDGEAAWAFFVAKVPELGKSSAPAKQLKPKKEKAPKAKKEPKEKKVREPKVPKVEKEKDKYGFTVGSANHKFAHALEESDSLSMVEVKKADWNETAATFYVAFKELCEKGFAEKTEDGRMRLKKA